jgi:peptidyl-prolyl cis-trans isomerase C
MLSGCSGSLLARPTPTSSPVPPSPTPTPEPLAARVDGAQLTLAAFMEEVARYEAAQASLGIDLATLGDYKRGILQALIDRLLLVQGGARSGLSVEPVQIDSRFDELVEEMGSPEAFGAWLAASGYTSESFRAALETEIMAAQMVEQIATGIPDSLEHVHARHILLASQAEAEALLAQLAAGADFADLARAVSLDLSTRPAGGDLGWFPRGYLLAPTVEAAAFALQAGERSGVVASQLGFHIIEVLERADRPLTHEARSRLSQHAVAEWLERERQSTSIEIYVTP